MTDHRGLHGVVQPDTRVCGSGQKTVVDNLRMLIVRDEISAIQRVLVVDRPVEPADDLVFMIGVWDPVNIPPTGIVRDWSLLQEIERNRIQRGLSNLVSGEYLSQCFRHAVV